MQDEIEWLEPALKGGRVCTKSPTLVTAHVGTKHGDPAYVNFYFGTGVVETMGWKIKDKICMGKTKSGSIAFMLANGNDLAAGYRLDKNGDVRANKGALRWFPKDFRYSKLRLSWSKQANMLVFSVPSEKEVYAAELKAKGGPE